MGLLSRIWPFQSKADPRILTSADLDRLLARSGGSRSGAVVNTTTALDQATVLAVVRVIANGVAQVPWHLYREAGGKRVVENGNSLDNVLYRRPNPWQTSFEFRETLMFHLLLTWNAYVFVNRVGPKQEIAELIPIEPGRVSVRQRDDYALEYTVEGKSGSRQTFPQAAIWHLRGPSWNSWSGMDAIRLARNAIGLSISLEEGQGDFQRHGAKTSGLFSVTGSLSPEKYALLRSWFEKELADSSDYRPLILDNDAKFTPFTMSGVDQQLLETRKHQIEEICRGFNVMPLMIGHPADMAARAATESIFLHHVTHCLMPWYQRIEQSADVNLLTDDDRKAGLYTKLNPAGLMRGASKDQADYFAKALGSGGTKGWMTQNEIRGALDLDVSDDPEADKLPQAAQASTSTGDPPEPPVDDDDEDETP